MSDGPRTAGTGYVPAPAVAADRVQSGRQPRPATAGDVPEILRLIRELADYERALHEVSATPELLTELLFGGDGGPLPGPAAACHVIDADPGTRPGTPELAAMALWFRNASTWLAVPGIYLEDLYVSPAYRGRGYGRTLLATLARLCVQHGFGRLDWSVLDWNESALGFYRALGAEAMSEWTGHRLTGPALLRLAAEASEGAVPGPEHPSVG